MVKRFVFLWLWILAATTLLWGQGGQVTLIRSSPEPLPNCTPSTGTNKNQPQIWDTTSQTMKTCTATNTWTNIGTAPGTLFYQTVQSNGTPQSQQPTVNFVSGTNMTITPTTVGSVTTLTFTSAATAATNWSALAPGTNSTSGNFVSSGNSWDFTAATILKLRVGSALTTSANGDLAYDTTNSNWHAWNGADKIVGLFNATPTNGHCLEGQVSSGVVTMIDAGAPCATGSTATWSTITNGTNSNAGTFTATGNSWDWTGTTIFKLRVGAGLTASANGDLGYDTTNKNWHAFDNAADALVGVWASTPTNGHCVSAQVSSGVVTLLDAGGICSTGSTSAFSSLTSGTNSNAGTFTATGNSWDFTGATIFKLRVGAALTTSANGDIGYDTTNKNWHAWDSAADLLLGVWTAAPTNGHCVSANVSAGVVQLQDSGAACASVVNWNTLTAGTNSNAGTFAMSGNTLNLTAAAATLVPTSAGYAPTANGSVGYNTTANKYVFGQNSATVSFSLPGSCVSQVVTATSPTAAPTCSTPTTTINGVTCNLYGTCTISASGGANTALSNLIATALNQDLLCATNGSCSLGSAAVNFNNEWLAGNLTVGGNIISAGGFFLGGGATLFNFAAPGGTCSSGATYTFGICVGDSTGGSMIWDSISGTPRTILSLTSNLVSGNLPVASSTRAEADSGVGAASGRITLKPGLFSALPTCNSGAEGTEGSVTDSTTNTWGATITGGSSDHVMAYCDGTQWTVAAK